MILALLFTQALAATVAATYPDPKLTPGAYDPNISQANIQQTICVSGSTKDTRHVSEKTKRQVYEMYDLDYEKLHGKYEVDHFVSLELGGLNDISNLWPQRYLPKPGAREKDVVETHLKRSICAGKLTLDQGRMIVKQDWYRCYLRIKAKQECEVKNAMAQDEM